MNKIFPAPLSTFEHFLLLDNREAFPLDFYVHVEIEGPLDHSQLEHAFRSALNGHPLLTATVSQKRRQYVWNASPQEPMFRVFESEAGDQGFEKSAINIFEEPGVRLNVIRGRDVHELVFQFHHTATDGLGAFGLINDVFLIYARDYNQSLPLPCRDSERLKTRYSCGYHSGSLWHRVSRTIRGLLKTREFLGAKISPISAHKPNVDQPRSAADTTRHVSYEFSIEETDALKKYARSSGVSLNSLLIRDAFIAVDRAKSKFECYRQDEYIRIAVPGNLRPTRANDGIPAANFFSMTFPARNPIQISNPEALLQSVHRAVQDGRKCFYFATFYLGLKIARMLPGFLPRKVNAAHCQTTLLLTNLGTAISEFPRSSDDGAIVIGDATVTQVELVAPMRPYQSIAVSTLEYCGRQTLTLAYDPRVHSDEAAVELLADYVQQLKKCTVPEQRLATPIASN